MVQDLLLPTLVVSMGLVGYAFLIYRLTAFVQPWRLEAASRGEKLLRSPALPEGGRKILHWLLDNAYSGWLPWLVVIASFALPLYFMRLIKVIDIDVLINDAGTRKEFIFVTDRLMWSAMATSPIAFSIAFVPVFITVLILILAASTHAGVRRAMRRVESIAISMTAPA